MFTPNFAEDLDLVRQIHVSGLDITRRRGLVRRKASALSPAVERFARQFAQTGDAIA